MYKVKCVCVCRGETTSLYLLLFPSLSGTLYNSAELSPCSEQWKGKGRTDRVKRDWENMVLFYVNLFLQLKLWEVLGYYSYGDQTDF